MEINKNYDDKKLIMEVTGRVDTITSQDLEKVSMKK